MRIYTKTGDAGETDLFDGQRVSKSDARIELLGAIDEANAWLGVAVANLTTDDVLYTWFRETLIAVQRRLFVAGGDVAAPGRQRPGMCQELRVRIPSGVKRSSTAVRHSCRSFVRSFFLEAHHVPQVYMVQEPLSDGLSESLLRCWETRRIRLFSFS